MNWDAIGAIGEIVGALAVVVTLGYLAAQQRQSNKIARAESYAKVIDAHVGHHRVLSDHPELAQLYARGLIDFVSLSPMDKARFHSFMEPIVLEFQKYRYLHQQGLMGDDTFEMFENDVVSNMLSPGGAEWWRGAKGRHPEISSYLDRRIAELGESLIPTHEDMAGVFGRGTARDA